MKITGISKCYPCFSYLSLYQRITGHAARLGWVGGVWGGWREMEGMGKNSED